MRQRANRTYAHSVWLLTDGKEQPFTMNRESYNRYEMKPAPLSLVIISH